MTDIELVKKIAPLLGYEESITDNTDDPSRPRFYDAECNEVPNYVMVLGRRRAEELLEILTVIDNWTSPKGQSFADQL